MKVAVAGLWHLGSVTAACMAEHFPVVGFDESDGTIEALKTGEPPVAEPGLAELTKSGLASGRLRFSSDPQAVADADILWVTFDTPVDDDDQADVEFVRSAIWRLLPVLPDGCLVLISSQVPVGFTADLQKRSAEAFPNKTFAFAYSPENLRLGSALQVFRKPERVVVGADPVLRDRLSALLTPIGAPIEWMAVASAELTKHAINAFLATSVTFANELAVIAERVNAHADEVKRGLQTDGRIGPKSYLKAGAAFAGGTLARDVVFLGDLGRKLGVPTLLLSSVKASNDAHKSWASRTLERVLGSLAGRQIALLGLTYKPGTDTLRRSSAVELGRFLSAQGVLLRAFDPALGALPLELRDIIALKASVPDAIAGADAVVVATEWPEFKELAPESFIGAMKGRPVVVDINRHLAPAVRQDARIHYVTIGV